jgi:tetratricopeptide (TPR) repeat protein
MKARLVSRLGLLVLLGFPLLAAPVEAARQPARDAQLTRGAADSVLAPLSVTLTREGEARLERRQNQEAIDAFETALAVDPRNVKAYLGLARAFEAEGLPGRAIRFYREALLIDPNDVLAIESQGHAYLARGAKGRAEGNLERLRKLCAQPCPAADRLAAAVERGPAAPAMAANAAPSTPAQPRQ